MYDYSNLTRLGILDVDPGAILGNPSPNAFKPIPYLPLNEPLQKPDFSALTVPSNDKFVKQGKDNKEVNTDKETNNDKSTESDKQSKKFNWKKFIGITSIVALAAFGLPKLIKAIPAIIKKIPNLLKKKP